MKQCPKRHARESVPKVRLVALLRRCGLRTIDTPDRSFDHLTNFHPLLSGPYSLIEPATAYIAALTFSSIVVLEQPVTMHFAAAFLSVLPALSLLASAMPSPAPEALNAFRVSPHQQAHGQRDMAEYAKAAGHGAYRRKVKRTLHKGEKRGCKATTSKASTAAASPTTTLVAGGAVAISTTVSSAPAATSTSAAGSGQTFSGGFATYFYQNGNAGACGIYHADSDLIGAIDMHWWPDFSQPSQYCGKQVVITNSNNGKSATITIADVCPTCVSDNSIDLSEGAFAAIADLSDGMVPITWRWA